TGLTVKTIRFYSDRGIVTPIRRSPAGYRLYGAEAAARLELVRTLRDLGLDLATIRKVVDRELSLPEVAAAHADALAVQIRTLRLRRAVLAAVADRGATSEEMDLMHKLAKLSGEERRTLIGDFLDAVLGGSAADPVFAGIRRSMTPELPDNPGTEQLQAWVELAELSQDPGFRAALGRTVQQHTYGLAEGGPSGPPRPDPVAVVRDRVAPALAAGIEPVSARAEPTVAELTARCADAVGSPDDPDFRRRLVARLESANDPRRQRYLELLAVVNGWTPPDDPAPAIDWTLRALRARLPEDRQ
uniref:MerR family transcriptional regulator n=1 Tax=Peterkaempfera griseoplana TaxID=66896 RepID=UPI0007C68538